jgi:hypothetical protein
MHGRSLQQGRPAQGRFAGERFLRHDRTWRRAGLAALVLLAAGSVAGLFGQPTTTLRAAAVYLFVLVVFRFAGQRTLAQITNFDLILVLIIGDATQNALVGSDSSLAAARGRHGLTRLSDVEFAVLESNGGISIIPKVPE